MKRFIVIAIAAFMLFSVGCAGVQVDQGNSAGVKLVTLGKNLKVYVPMSFETPDPKTHNRSIIPFPRTKVFGIRISQKVDRCNGWGVFFKASGMQPNVKYTPIAAMKIKGCKAVESYVYKGKLPIPATKAAAIKALDLAAKATGV